MSRLTKEMVQQVVRWVGKAGDRLDDPDAIRTVTPKSKTDFVTNVDVSVEQFLRRRLMELTPWAQFLGEEGEKTPIDPARPFWILDPVDGTTNLIHGFRHSAVSLALAEDGEITFGVVCQPYTRECFTAMRGKGAFRNSCSIRVSGVERLADGLISAGTVPGRRDLADMAFEQMRRIYDVCQDVRRTGCASLDLCWVACGRLDGFVEQHLQPWDYAAGLLIVEEAGGRVTALDGAPLSLTQGGGVLASNGMLHHQLMKQLEG